MKGDVKPIRLPRRRTTKDVSLEDLKDCLRRRRRKAAYWRRRPTSPEWRRRKRAFWLGMALGDAKFLTAELARRKAQG